MRALLKLSDGISAVVSRIGKAAAFLFIPMMLVISYDVAQRKYLEYDPGFSSSELFRTLTSTKLQELEWHLHAVLFLLCLGFAYVRDAHVRIELVRERLGPRTRVWIELARMPAVPHPLLLRADPPRLGVRRAGLHLRGELGGDDRPHPPLDHQGLPAIRLPHPAGGGRFRCAASSISSARRS